MSCAAGDEAVKLYLPHVNGVIPRNAMDEAASQRTAMPGEDGTLLAHTSGKGDAYIWPHTPMGSWRVKATLVLLSTSMLCRQTTSRRWSALATTSPRKEAATAQRPGPLRATGADSVRFAPPVILRSRRRRPKPRSIAHLCTVNRSRCQTDLAHNLVCPARIVTEALHAVSNVEIPSRYHK